MYSLCIIFVLLPFGFIIGANLPTRDQALLISKYAKVSRWGSVPSKQYSQGQSPWTHRSDVFITSSQNPRIKSKVDMAEVPGVGEIQERFNPRPYFAYGQIPGKSSVSNRMPPTVDATYKTPELSKDVLPQIPFLPTQPPKAHADLYTSPYSSYNPPPSNTDDKDKDSFDSPPNETDIQPDEGAGPPEDQHPLIGSDDSVSFPDPPNKGKKPNQHSYTPDESDSEGAEYFPPDDDHHNPKEIILDHPPPGYENHGSVEMAPPPPPPNFPQYLYDDPHHADHVYQEIEHTTPQEKERVNKAHYSYYYLGRKLWYDDNTSRESRGMMMMMDDEHKDHHPVEEQKAVKEDPWAGYYDFIINEGSFKFWAVFQVVTAVLLIYSAFAAVYYAKFNVITTDYADYFYDDDFFARSNNDQPYSSIWGKFSAQTLQRIFDALSSKKFS